MAFSNLLVYGFSGAGIHILLTICVLATTLLGWRVGIISIGISIAAIFIAGYALSAGLVEIDPILFQTSISPIAWSTAAVTFLMLSGAMVVTAGFVQFFLQHAIEELQMYREQLERLVAERTNALVTAQERIIRQERLAVLGQLAGVVGYELRNPLGVISNAAYYLNMVTPETNEKEREYVELVQLNTQEATQIVNDLLVFAQATPVKQSAMNVSENVGEVIAQQPAPENVTFHQAIPVELPCIYVDKLHIMHILSNMVINAYQAMPDGGQLTIAAQVIQENIEISITDTGIGIPPENMDKIFEPLFTTKSKGIGLGLAICKNLIEANDGRIHVESKIGVGTIFRLYIPIYEGEK